MWKQGGWMVKREVRKGPSQDEELVDAQVGNAEPAETKLENGEGRSEAGKLDAEEAAKRKK